MYTFYIWGKNKAKHCFQPNHKDLITDYKDVDVAQKVEGWNVAVRKTD